MLNSPLRNRRRSVPQASATRHVSLQPLMAPERDLAAVQRSLDEVGRRLNVSFALQQGAGDIVLLDGALLPHLSVQQVEAFREDRPAVTLPSLLGKPQGRVDEVVQASLLQQFEALQVVDRRGAAANGGSAWHTAASMSLNGVPEATIFCPSPGMYVAGAGARTPASQQQDSTTVGAAVFVAQVFEALGAATVGDGPLAAARSWGYGPQANLFFDFKRRQVVCDLQALQRLRVRFELPHLSAKEGPCFDAGRRGMNEVLWDLGLASAALPLRAAPADWLDVAFSFVPVADIRVLTRQPCHLEAVRRLQAGPTTAGALRRSMRFTTLELKQFMQALSFLDRLRWITNKDLESHPP